MYSKEFNNCYILLSNISQALENTKFIAGELSLIVSLVLYCPTSVYEPLEDARLYLDGTMQMWVDAEDSLEI